MAEKDKRVVFRLDDETWTKYDDRRHSERTTFQDLGEKLFAEWANPQISAIPTALTPEESVHVAALLYALRNANDDKLFQIELLLKPFLNKPAAQSPARRKSA